jgi:hypothetical protein
MSNTLTTNTINKVSDFDLAVTGVFSLQSVSDWTVQEWQDNGIDPDAADYEEHCRTEWESKNYNEAGEWIGEGDEDDTCNQFDMSDMGYWDNYQQTSILIGFKEANEEYEEDESAPYSAIIGLDNAFGGTVQVTRSKFFIKGSWCSPCFPGQVDADTEGSILAFALDPEDIHTDECAEGVELANRIFTRPE